MATATAMYHSARNPLKGISRDPQRSEKVDIVRGERRRRLHKAFLRWHDANNWPLLREALQAMGRADLIGNGRQHLIPSFQPQTCPDRGGARRGEAKPAAPVPGRLLTQHTGLPPRDAGGAARRKPAAQARRHKLR